MKHNKAYNVDGWLVIDKPKGTDSTQVTGKTGYLMYSNKNGVYFSDIPFIDYRCCLPKTADIVLRLRRQSSVFHFS